MAGFEATAQEQQFIKTVFAKADTQDLGVVTGEEAVKIFAGSGLAPATLGEIWQLADTENNGFLTEIGLGIALRLIGWAQAGESPKKDLITRIGPLPTIKGIPIPGVSSAGSPMPRSPPPSLPARPIMPQLTPEDRQKFLRMFFQSGPSNGLLNGDKARDLFLKSKLPTEKLGQIWQLADTHDRGSLDSTDFIIGMFLIQSVMTGTLHILPPSLPPGLYEQASGGASRPTVGSPLQAQFTGTSTSSRPSAAFPQRAASPIRSQYTGQAPLEAQYTGNQRRIAPQYTGQSQLGQSSVPASVIRPQLTGQPFALPQPQPFAQPKWDVSPEEKVKSDTFFATLDPQGRGFIEGDVAVAFMVQSKLPETVLAQVWDLADLNKDGRLTRDGFAVAMHLINGKLAGREIPNELPPSLIPPSFRGGVGAHPPAPPAQSETLRDLWSLDEPVQAPTPPAPAPAPALAPKPHRNLFDDDDEETLSPTAPTALNGTSTTPSKSAAATHSIEIANVQNQLSSTQRALDSATAARQAASVSADAGAAELASLKEQLQRAAAARATEENHLAEIRARKVAQDAELTKVREELIRVESEVSAIRLERGELETSLLRDKEEIRGIQKKMREVSDEVERSKGDVEKLKRETRQVKGLLAIAKKQLVTAEGEKAKVEKETEEARNEGDEARRELEDVERKVADGQNAELTIIAPIPTINGASTTLSPQATGTDRLSPAQVELPASRAVTPADKPAPQRAGSTNPFDRLRGASTSTLPFADVPAGTSPFGAGTPTSPFGANPGSPTLSPTVTSPFAALPDAGPMSFDAVFGDAFGTTSSADAADATKTPEIPQPPGEGPKNETAASVTAPATASEDEAHKPLALALGPSFHAPADDEDPFGMSADEPAAGKAKEEKDKVQENKSSKPAEPTKPEEDPEVAAAASQFPALSLENSPAKPRDSHDLPPLTELEQPDDSDSDDEPLDRKAQRLARSGATTDAPTPLAAPAEITPTPAPAAPAAPAPAASASAFNNAFGLPSAPAPAAATGASAFDEAFKAIPANNKEGAPKTSAFSFENSFDDNFDFASATKDTGANAFPSSAQSAASPVIPGAFTFDDAFGTGNTSVTSNGKAEGKAPSKGVSFDEVFGFSGPTAPKPETGSAKPSFDAFGPSSFTAPTPAQPPKPEPVPVPPPIQPPGSASTMSRPSPPTSPTTGSMLSGRTSSPKTKRSESPKAQPRPQLNPPPEPAQRHSKLSLHFPSFGRSKTTKGKKDKKDKSGREQIPDMPSAPPGSGTPGVDDDVEAVKQLCAMGFSRGQAVNALETHGYDFQKALNSLVGS